jgi:flagellar hook protein FlgE
MSLFGALYAAVSGLNANSDSLGIISDNIANANTIGYKDTSTNFAALVTQSSPSDYSPGGVIASPLYGVAQQGSIQTANSATDLAISGGGFFVVNSSAAGNAGGGTTSFTRAGNFTVDADGNLVNAAGLYLQGQTLSAAQSAAIAAGQPPTLSGTTIGALQTVNVDGLTDTASPTANVTLAANLPANSTTPETMTVPVFDSEGVEHDLTLTFTPTGTANQWGVSAAFANGDGTATIAGGDSTVQFNGNGSLNSGLTTFNAANALSIAWNPAVTGATSPQTLTFNIGTNGSTNGLSQLGSAYNVTSINQDGVQVGTFSSASVGSNGVVTGNFSNGLTRAIAIVPIATFEDPDGLAPTTGTSFVATEASGLPLLAQAGSGAAGTIDPSSLESSTVDIATEFSQLIVAQNAYSANSRVITTADQMIQSLLNIQTA